MLATTASEQLHPYAQGDTMPLQQLDIEIAAYPPIVSAVDKKQQVELIMEDSRDGIDTIKMLVASLKCGSQEAMAAMRTLIAVADGNKGAQISIGDAGGVDAVASLFSINQREQGATELLISAVALLRTLMDATQNVQRPALHDVVQGMLSAFPEAPPNLQLAIVELLTTLHNSPAMHDTMTQESARTNLLSVLQLDARVLSDASVRTAVMALLRKLVDAEMIRRNVVAMKIKLFVAAIREGSGGEQEAAAHVTVTLMNDSPSFVTAAALRGGVVDAFVRMITSAERVDVLIPRIEQLIAKFWAVRSAEANAGAVAIVRAMIELAQSTPGRRGNAVAMKLTSWATAWEYIELLVEAGVVQAAATALKREVTGQPVLGSFTRQHAMAAMSVIGLSAYNSTLVDEGAADVLITTLKAARPGFRDEITMILYNTAWSYPPLRPLLRTSGCLEIFVDMLRDGTQDEKDAAAGALAAACIDCKRNVASLPHNELLDLCVPMLLTGEGHAPNAALRLIKSLTDDSAVGKEVARHATIVNLSMQLLSRDDSGHQIHAALAVESFARHSASRQQMIEAGVEAALKRIRTGEPEPASYARFALGTLRVETTSDSESDGESD